MSTTLLVVTNHIHCYSAACKKLQKEELALSSHAPTKAKASKAGRAGSDFRFLLLCSPSLSFAKSETLSRPFQFLPSRGTQLVFDFCPFCLKISSLLLSGCTSELQNSKLLFALEHSSRQPFVWYRAQSSLPDLDSLVLPL